MNYVIGCGGVGSRLAFELAGLRRKQDDVVLIDGDKLEEKNLDRQLFTEDDLGLFKAEALCDRYKLHDYENCYFSPGMGMQFNFFSDDVLWVAVDNHPARLAALNACDTNGCCCVIGANEYTEAEAYWYDPNWRNTVNDPRVFYPAILTERDGDPLGPPGCQGAAQEASPQLGIANMWAAAMMLQLFWFYTEALPKIAAPDAQRHWPVLHKVNEYRFSTIKFGDR